MNERTGEVWATVKCSVRGGDVDEGRLDLALPSRNSVAAFIGQVSSRAGTPLVVDAHAVSFRKCGVIQSRPLKEALNAAKFDRLSSGPSLSA